MRVLVVTQYYRPEVGAPPNRLGAFVDGLVEAGHGVEVICEQPNHPSGVFAPGYGGRPMYCSYEDRTRVRRLWVATSPEKTTAQRLAFYTSFAAGAGAMTGVVSRPDVIFTSSPPLPGTLAVAAAASARRIPFVIDVRDLWPAAAEALGELSNPRILRLLERAERWAYQAAARVTTTTEPFCAHIDARGGDGKAVHLPNGALDALLDVGGPNDRAGGPFTVGYAGNFGIAQGLGIVLDAAEETRNASVRFLMVGDGPVKQRFLAERERRNLTERVEVRPEASISELAPMLAACDALLVPLRDAPLLRSFIPSKLYDAMALGRPVIAAAPGEPQRVVEEIGCGIAIGAEDGHALAGAIAELRSDGAAAAGMGRAGRAAARNLVRSRQVERLEKVLGEAALSR